MASTELQSAATGANLRELNGADLSDCVALSRSANWNQNEADWRMMLAFGRGWGIEATSGPARGRLAASVVVIPYHPVAGAAATRAVGTTAAGCAWISMVLVLPAFRRQGLATRLLRQALRFLKDEGLAPLLDATPAGYPVYLQEGFASVWGFRRYHRVAACLEPDAPPPRTRRIEEADWPGILAFDAPVFGLDRERVLRGLAGRLPEAARLAEREDGRITGFVFGRDGLEACQIGPLLAEDSVIAQRLLDDVLRAVTGPVLLDLADRHLELLEGLVARGFVLQRPFTRMAQRFPAPGDPALVVLVGGPEFG